jgi:putative membrane protein
MRRLALAVGVLAFGVAGSNQAAFGDWGSKRCGCEKVSYRDCGKCPKVRCEKAAFRSKCGFEKVSFRNKCNRCEKVAFRSKCDPCERVAFHSNCNRCEKVQRVAFRGCNKCPKVEKVAFRHRCDRVALRGCDPCDRGSFFGFLGFGRDHDYVAADYRTGYDVRYDTRYMPGAVGYEPDYQLGYDQPYGYREPASTAGVYLTANQPGADDATFVREAAIANMAEVELGRLALQNASSTEVRNFGQHMIDDHGQAQSNLEAIAVRMNLDIPDDLDQPHEQIAQQLSGLTASEFDRQFMDTMVRDHREVIAKFEARADAAPANEIQSFAIETLPKLRHHLQMATDIQGRIGR